jgi:hypothetical protein
MQTTPTIESDGSPARRVIPKRVRVRNQSTATGWRPPNRRCRASSVEGASAIGDTDASRFAAHVHEVVGLDKRRAPLQAIEACIDSMTVDVEEQSGLWLLAWFLRARQTAADARVWVSAAPRSLTSA